MVILILIFLGLCFGSFITALTWRLKINKISKNKHNKKLSVVNGRSMCEDCHHQLSILDLIPVLSWVVLRGKCRYCHKSISWQNPLIELTTVGVFIVSYLFWPINLHGRGLFDLIAWLVIAVGLVAIAVYDLRSFIIPNRIIYPLMVLGLIYVALNLAFFKGGVNSLEDALWGVLIISGTFYLLFQLSGGKWIGGGDVKLGFLLGLISWGPIESLLLLFIASLSGTLVSLPLLMSKRANAKTHLPFAPFLILAAIICQIVGPSIVHHIQN